MENAPISTTIRQDGAIARSYKRWRLSNRIGNAYAKSEYHAQRARFQREQHMLHKVTKGKVGSRTFLVGMRTNRHLKIAGREAAKHTNYSRELDRLNQRYDGEAQQRKLIKAQNKAAKQAQAVAKKQKVQAAKVERAKQQIVIEKGLKKWGTEKGIKGAKAHRVKSLRERTATTTIRKSVRTSAKTPRSNRTTVAKGIASKGVGSTMSRSQAASIAAKARWHGGGGKRSAGRRRRP